MGPVGEGQAKIRVVAADQLGLVLDDRAQLGLAVLQCLSDIRGSKGPRAGLACGVDGLKRRLPDLRQVQCRPGFFGARLVHAACELQCRSDEVVVQQ